ncbi:MAG: trigger factor [Anaeroplasmataceae bacterium]|nr:trigger factor [Anaeroplasmataceae bacterium]
MKVEKLEHSRNKVVFEVTPEEFEKALDKAFEKCNAKVTIKGFRAGKAPRSVYEKMYGVESLYDEAINVVLNNKAQEIYKDQDLAKEIVGPFEPNFESDEKLERGKSFKVSLSFDVYPEVNLPQYKGVECVAANLTVSDADVDAAIKSIMAKDASMEVKKEQVIEAGDTANFDFVGSVDGVEFPGGKAENYELEIGSGQFIPGFEDQMIGMKADEVKDVNVTFPENYGEKSLAGKLAVFKVTVHEVKHKIYPELTDEYVKEQKLTDIETVAAWKKAKKAELEASREKSEKDRQVDEIINKILDNAVVDMPKALEEERISQVRGQYEQQAKMYNIPFETFLGLMNITKEKFEEDTEKQGKRQALFNVVVSKIIEVENLTPTKEDIEARAEADAKAHNSKKEVMLRNNAQRYYSDIAYQRVVDLLLSNATMVGEAAPKKAPAKTSTAKTTAAKSSTKSTTAKASTTKSSTKTTATKTSTAKSTATKKTTTKKTTKTTE